MTEVYGTMLGQLQDGMHPEDVIQDAMLRGKLTRAQVVKLFSDAEGMTPTEYANILQRGEEE